MNGVLVGADKNQEWLLPWWWENYAKYNDFPVAFADFGMSNEAQEWCRIRGEVISIRLEPATFSRKLSFTPTRTAYLQEKHGTQFLQNRSSWFQKPFACLKSPFDLTAWIDLDCEILCNLEVLFQHLRSECDVAAVRQAGLSLRWTIYNSGVLLFRKNGAMIRAWAADSLRMHHRFVTDDNVLSRLIRRDGSRFQELPQGFNWYMYQGYNYGAVILHWMCRWGKEYIRKFGGIHGSLK